MKTISKLKDLDYNEFVALQVIERDEDLLSMFNEEVTMSFSMVKTLSQKDKLSTETQEYVRELFDKIILTKENLIDWYLRLSEGKEIKPVAKIKAKESDTKDAGLPRRYGKAYIMKDIEAQGGKATNAQLTALAVNDLKNLWVTLQARMVKDMLLEDSEKISAEDLRTIRATIKLFKNKVSPILKK